jgi:5-methylcytosine-specific restriction endonuclease McrA
MARKSYTMPSKGSIYEYWKDNPKEYFVLDELSLINENTCFACGKLGTQRCHIKPRIYGGDERLENLHLLCNTCHVESESYMDDEYWRWFEYQRKNEYKYYIDHLAITFKKIGFDINDPEHRTKMLERFAGNLK